MRFIIVELSSVPRAAIFSEDGIHAIKYNISDL